MKYRIGYAAAIGEKDVFSAIDYAVEHGMNAVELNMNMPCFFPENYSREARSDAGRYAREKDVALTMHAPEDIPLLQLHQTVMEAGLGRLKEIIDFGKAMGVSRMTVHIGSPPYFTMTEGKGYLDELHYDEFKQGLIQALNELADYGGEQLMVCVENSGRFPKRLVQEVLDDVLASKKLFLTWDIGHSYTNLYKEVEFFHRHLDRVKTCHLHDVNEKSDHQVIGTGKVDFSGHFSTMGDRDVIYVVEVRPREKAAQSFINLQQLLAEK